MSYALTITPTLAPLGKIAPPAPTAGVKRRSPDANMSTKAAPRKRSRTDTNDDNGKKTRGRPRVEGEDETAADRRRTQIRLAQRAYRQRKESTISNLKKQVSSLKTTLDDMENLFLAYNDHAMSSGMLQKQPDLARELKATTEAFIQLAKRSHGDDNFSNSESDLEEVPQRKPVGTFQADVTTFLGHDVDLSTLSSATGSHPAGQEAGYGILGYSQEIFGNWADGSTRAVSKAPVTSTAMSATSMFPTTTMNLADMTFTSTSSNTNPLAMDLTSSNISSRALSMTSPTVSERGDILGLKSPSAPYTYSFEETTFARRLQRAALERGFYLLTQAEVRPQTFQRVFRLSLLYRSRDTLIMSFRRTLSRSSEEPLETFQTPFIHLGGAGLHYNAGRIRNGYIIKPGPIQRRAVLESTERSGAITEIDFDMTEYEGEWFDSNDVEGYLNEKGLYIVPQTSFAEGRISLPRLQAAISGSAEVFGSPASNHIDSVTAASTSPHTPNMSEAQLDAGVERLFPEFGAASPNTLWQMEAADWLLGSGNKTPDFLESGWNEYRGSSPWNMLDAVGMVDSFAPENIVRPSQQQPMIQEEEKRNVTVDVNKFIDELIRTGICLGRAPGFRKADVDRALSAAIIQVM